MSCNTGILFQKYLLCTPSLETVGSIIQCQLLNIQSSRACAIARDRNEANQPICSRVKTNEDMRLQRCAKKNHGHKKDYTVHIKMNSIWPQELLRVTPVPRKPQLIPRIIPTWRLTSEFASKKNHNSPSQHSHHGPRWTRRGKAWKYRSCAAATSDLMAAFWRFLDAPTLT